MFGSTFERSGNHEERRLQSGRSRCNTDDLRLSCRDSACFIQDCTVDLAEQFKRFSTLKENASASAAASAHHDGSRRGEAERAGAGNDEDGDGAREREGEVTSKEEPHDKREEGNADHYGNENAAHAVSEACNRGL